MGFLAVPEISEGAQVAATLSTFASLGSIIVGVFSIWRHQSNTSTKDSVSNSFYTITAKLTVDAVF